MNQLLINPTNKMDVACIRDFIQTSWHWRPEVFQKGCGVHGVCSGTPPLYLGGMRESRKKMSRSYPRLYTNSIGRIVG